MKNNTTHDLLISSGFNFFFSNNPKSEIIYCGDIVKLSRIPVNGVSLREESENLEHLFSCKKVYDHINRRVKLSG